VPAARSARRCSSPSRRRRARIPPGTSCDASERSRRANSLVALKSTIFKAELQVSDMDRGHYAMHSLTIARHPSETDERMMVRLLAFALNADDTLEFGRGLS